MDYDLEDTDFAHDADSSKSRPFRSYMATFFDEQWDGMLESGFISWSELYDLPVVAEKLQVHLQKSYSNIRVKFLENNVETCPSTGRIHCHMIISCDRPFRFTPLRDFDEWKHCDSQHYKGIYNMDGARDYLKKIYTKSGHLTRIDGPWSWGTPPRQGKSDRPTQLGMAISAMEETGWKAKVVADEYPEVYVKHFNGLHQLESVRGALDPAECMSDIILLFGSPGSGKTHYALSIEPDSTYSGMYTKYSNLYFDYFKNERVMFFDEMNGHLLPFDTFKKWFNPGSDGRRIILPQRIGSAVLGSSTIVMATNRNPATWWDLVKLKADPWELFRRFTKVMVFFGCYGDVDDPSWRIVLESKADIRAFMRHCCAARDNGWDADTFRQFLITKYRGPDAGPNADVVINTPGHDSGLSIYHSPVTKRARSNELYENAAPFL